jgi:DNA-binding LacI/PurR family transcriptional regulator
MSQRVTIKDVAARAAVSYQTVSKVLNKQAQVSKETEARIWEAVQAVGYRPNWSARSLRSRRSFRIGYSWAPASSEQGNAILDQFLQGLAQAGQKVGYQVLTFAHQPAGQWIEAYREMMDTNQVDGFVLSSVEYDDPRIVLLQERNFPFVAFGRSNPGWDFPYVDVDGAAGMVMLVEHLVARGHRKIAALAWSENSRVGNNRMEGFQGALAAARIRPAPEWIQRGEGVCQFGKQATARLLDLPQENRPTAIVAFNDFMAVGAIQAVQARGLQVGSDLAITGFEDNPIAQYLSPPLTSVRQPVLEIGQQVMRMLAGILSQQSLQGTALLLQPELIIRESSAPERI